MKPLRLFLVLIGVALVPACETQPTGEDTLLGTAPTIEAGAVKFWEDNASVYWNGIARGLVVKYLQNPFFAMRAYAILSTAQYNAVIGAEQGSVGSNHPSPTAAIAGASAVALTYLFPAETAALETLVDNQLAAPRWPGERNTDAASGEAIGRAVGQQVVLRATTDNFFAPWSGTVPTGPGIWFSSANPPAPPAGPLFGQARTYFLSSGDQFRPAPPPAFGSAEFLAALAEVRLFSDTRTFQQDSIAKFWAFPGGTFTPPGFWNQEASNLVVRFHLSERETAHVLALTNMAGFDALVACHDAKYAYWLLRPSQADPLITLSIGLPNFPAYPSNHACISAAQARVLGTMFPSERFRLDAMADEAALSRVYGGIHYRFDGDIGLELGRKVASLALKQDVRGHEAFVLK